MKTAILVASAIAAGLATFVLTSPAIAQYELGRSGPYLGGAVGYFRIDGDDFIAPGDKLHDNRIAYKGYGGWNYNSIFALEASYVDFGNSKDGNRHIDANGYTAALVVSIPMLKNFSPYAKVGDLIWDADTRSGGVHNSQDDDDLFYGVGVRFALNEHVDLRAEYERYKLDETDIDMPSLNLQYNF